MVGYEELKEGWCFVGRGGGIKKITRVWVEPSLARPHTGTRMVEYEIVGLDRYNKSGAIGSRASLPSSSFRTWAVHGSGYVPS